MPKQIVSAGIYQDSLIIFKLLNVSSNSPSLPETDKAIGYIALIDSSQDQTVTSHTDSFSKNIMYMHPIWARTGIMLSQKSIIKEDHWA